MNLELVRKASSLLRFLMEATDDDQIAIYKYLALCNVLARELGLYGYAAIAMAETPSELGEEEKKRADILIAVAAMFNE